MRDMPNQMDVLRWLMDYRKKYGPIRDEGIENLADYIAGEIRSALLDADEPTQ